MPIGPYLDRVRYVCSKLGTDKIILGAMSAWVYGGAANAMMHAVSISATSSILRVHMNEGNTPTFEVYRIVKSVVDVTACSSALDRAEGWQVVRDILGP
ncbi:hypothetical protein EVAR_57335_1 [Eumeta japonica]|uniref:Uncharacterized protein n=1 Tax=Eumeta variegata TaxID=151549 RepID=A0A4C2A0Y0_EUMVA|nr:hypothetical protein EVAR_57335_1 [Eumeta japonica]